MLIGTDALSRSSGDRRTTVAFGRLEPYEWKLSCTVLRGRGGCKASDLPGVEIVFKNQHSIAARRVRL